MGNNTMDDEHLETLATRKDFKIDWFSGKGAGGQHRNKHQNCCRITHIPTGMTEVGQNARERSRNQKAAFERLAKRVVAHLIHKEQRARYGNKERIRTYHQPNNRVTDHASGLQMSWDEIMGKNDLEPMITARLIAMINSDGE